MSANPMEQCPMLSEDGQPMDPGSPVYGRTFWDADLPAICMRACFRPGETKAEQSKIVRMVTVNRFTDAEYEDAYYGKGCNEGIVVHDEVGRTGYIELKDSDGVVLTGRKFGFGCVVEERNG